MTFEQFKASLEQSAPPAGLGLALQALWHDAQGDWDAAHRLAQSDSRPEGAWVHAYLHRKEGDLDNAGYWYSRAGRRRPATELDAEWEAIARALLGEGGRRGTTP